MEPIDAASHLSRARAGDPEAFRWLVERHSRSVFRLAYRMTGNEQDAEDVVQEAFLKAYRELGRFEARANFGTWIYRIAANCAIDLLRVRGRYEDRQTRDGDDVLHRDGPADAGPPPDRLLFSTEVYGHVAQAMDVLTPLERAAFVLRHFEDRTIEEIGGLLGLRTNATKHSIFRAVRKLRAALGPLVGKQAALTRHSSL
jgi:RNA polymerase sigma-70 factor (ECF subfamily)